MWKDDQVLFCAPWADGDQFGAAVQWRADGYAADPGWPGWRGGSWAVFCYDRFAGIYASPMPRAQTTAELIVAQSKVAQPAIVTVRDLREVDLGDWDGQPLASVQDDPQIDNYYHHLAEFDYKRIGAESFAEALNRGRRAIAGIYQQHPDGKVLVVAHGLLGMLLMSTYLGAELDDARDEMTMPPNNSISELDTDDGEQFTRGTLWAFVPSEYQTK